MKAVNPWLLPSVLKLWASNGPRSWWGIVSVLVWLGSCKKKQKQWIWLKNTCVFCKFYSYTFGCAKGMTFIHQGDNLHHTSFSCHASHARHANHAKMHWSVDLEFRHESLVHKSVTSVLAIVTSLFPRFLCLPNVMAPLFWSFPQTNMFVF